MWSWRGPQRATDENSSAFSSWYIKSQLPPWWKQQKQSRYPSWFLQHFMRRDCSQAVLRLGRRANVCVGKRTTASYWAVSSRSEDYTPGGLTLPCCHSYYKKAQRDREVWSKVWHPKHKEAGQLHVMFCYSLSITRVMFFFLQVETINYWFIQFSTWQASFIQPILQIHLLRRLKA